MTTQIKKQGKQKPLITIKRSTWNNFKAQALGIMGLGLVIILMVLFLYGMMTLLPSGSGCKEAYFNYCR